MNAHLHIFCTASHLAKTQKLSVSLRSKEKMVATIATHLEEQQYLEIFKEWSLNIPSSFSYSCKCIALYTFLLTRGSQSSDYFFNTNLIILCYTVRVQCIELRKRKTLKKHSLHRKIAASVLLKLFVNGNDSCNETIDHPSAWAKLSF